ncbi:NAD(P)/FAD-dependent oxidoreductase [Bacteriovorax sp. Seq25_V]|uniref:NAD(P)/FAD-dependent oxidoreductase n=1 Tax=Bacteriovorax sp. Seq25_V TaxID=1201288 RepID=UPI000389E9E3|nr:FAD-dependent oxidoreductase [Bacteriovorax sp. Seq25_V]EQC43403.1 NAD(P)-binding Rossmann-like domain protein [Bacteriovorax sp. Seq25_V]
MKKLAIIGTGISGMSSAYILKDHYDITIFEQNNYVGGHTNTVDVGNIPIDTGFIVFNYHTYPNLVKLFSELNVEHVDTNMSFAVHDSASGLEYCGSGLNGLFGQRKNIFDYKFWRMLFEINRFNETCLEVLQSPIFDSMTIGQYLDLNNYGEMMREKYLVPCASAIWSTSPNEMLHFPIKTLVRFFKNHGLLGLNSHFQWKTVLGGAKQYRDKLISSFKDRIKINEKVIGCKLESSKHIIRTENSSYEFDEVVFACHSNQALEILEEPSFLENELLSKFKYEYNFAQLHTDEALMPKNKRNWSAWNYYLTGEKEQKAVTTYYMNELQPLQTETKYFVTLNGKDLVNPEKVIKEIHYEHPSFNFEAINNQERLHDLNRQGIGRFYCGAYFRYGFHEDGIWSALKMCEKILNKEGELCK